MLKHIKYSLVLISVYLMSGGAIASENSWEEKIDRCESYISIYGSSNVNQFRFFNVNPQISLASNKSHNEAVHQEITIPVYDFTGPNNRMLNDFLKMINASEHPEIHILIEADELASTSETMGLTHFRTKISIAGNSRQYHVPCRIQFCETSGFIIKGDLKIKLTDFNIDPPQKIFGTVKVNNDVFINFAFQVKNENSFSEKITY